MQATLLDIWHCCHPTAACEIQYDPRPGHVPQVKSEVGQPAGEPSRGPNLPTSTQPLSETCHAAFTMCDSKHGLMSTAIALTLAQPTCRASVCLLSAVQQPLKDGGYLIACAHKSNRSSRPPTIGAHSSNLLLSRHPRVLSPAASNLPPSMTAQELRAPADGCCRHE